MRFLLASFVSLAIAYASAQASEFYPQAELIDASHPFEVQGLEKLGLAGYGVPFNTVGSSNYNLGFSGANNAGFGLEEAGMLGAGNFAFNQQQTLPVQQPNFNLGVSNLPYNLGAAGTGAKGMTQLPVITNTKQPTVAQPIMAQAVTNYRLIQQPILRPRIIQQPIIQTRYLEQPIMTVRQVIQPVIRPIITQPIIQPVITEQTTVQPQLTQQTIVRPRLMEQTVVQPQLIETAQEAQPITAKATVTQQAAVTAPVQSTKKSNTGLGGVY